MTKSMTAFARETATNEDGELTWELRSVNHRYLESIVRLPEELRALEPAVRERIAAKLGRGKLECALRLVAAPGRGADLQLNEAFLQQLVNTGQRVAQLIERSWDPDPIELLRWPGVLHERKPDVGPVMKGALILLDAALESLVATREREGARLAELMRARCEKLATCVSQARKLMPEVLREVRSRILQRLEEVSGELDPSRLEQELALLAQRLDVDEEMDRMAAHIEEVRSVLDGTGLVGRRLDFLMQELNREANTLGSKSSNLEITRLAVEMKVLIEQLREQVQNLE